MIKENIYEQNRWCIHDLYMSNVATISKKQFNFYCIKMRLAQSQLDDTL